MYYLYIRFVRLRGTYTPPFSLHPLVCKRGVGSHLKGCLTCMLHLKDYNRKVYSDGVSHKLWQSQGDILNPILFGKSQDVTRLPTTQCCTLPECHMCAPNALKLCPKQWWRQSLSTLGQFRSAEVVVLERSTLGGWQLCYILRFL